MADFMSPQDFAGKVEWEGGIIDTLDYGLKHTELDPDDPDSTELRAAWAELETAFSAMRPQIKRVETLLEAYDGDGGGE